jgi:peptide methionine sulfoxide reductase MsrB
MERSYTGNLWGEISPGFYHCAVCDTRLFTFDQKFNSDTGYACFYDCVDKRVTVLDEKTEFDTVNVFSNPFLEE